MLAVDSIMKLCCMKKQWGMILLLFFGCYSPMLAYGAGLQGSQSLYEAQQCISAIQQYENQYQIPKNLLHAISIVESGRWHEGAKKVMPWPWSVNVDGAAYYFDTRQQAVDFVKKKLKEGVGNIDVGCNQISWQFHGHNFESIEQAIHPVHNSKFAAQFLKQHYMETKDWVKATGRYHSRTEGLGSAYSQKVHQTWRGKYAKYPAIPRSNAAQAAKQNPYHNYYNPYYARRYGNSGAKIKVSTGSTPGKQSQGSQIATVTERVIK